ncbi:MAG: tRNA lysidine(34) synthetase TilS, partial [Dehalococcoidia bacterium]
AHIAALAELISKQTGKSLHLPRGVTATMEYGQCLLRREEPDYEAPPPLQGEPSINIPGRTVVNGWVIEADVMDRTQSWQPANGFEAVLDMDAVGSPLTVRARRRGDRFQPLGMSQVKKLQDFLVDSKVPRSQRDGIPLVCAQGRIVWVVGWRIDDRAKVTDSTQRVLLLRFQRAEIPLS